ncbi:cytochrome c oxidase accessory protein FixG [Loktanella fryxellensis]|uniref:Cytochrome c oxidase accessory protein FixG n=1 Tax=Loktanella fryxellensis TaxID=245187 RepID=A0A1H8HAA3_9RHOB|nr:cytochrome c oxidase accessory protein CcoG [Loktanella fryxellensis]SEN53152.1 cytochrome c oxidase accessory protein FixG [Loktanella fryxellensis]
MTSTSLYAPRVPIFPRRVSGAFRRLKWWIMAVTLAIYYVTPWIRWDRGPALPDQAVLIDMAHRRFYFLWIEIWPHEFYFVAGLLIMAGLGLFLFTAALGRVWCGYACPQTVWTDLFILVERWVEGDRNARLRLHAAPWSLRKMRLRGVKWSLWLVIAVATGGAWVFYFTDAPTLLRQIAVGQAPLAAYASIAVLTATTFTFGGFMREQVCIYMCPWPRIQSAMMDADTLTVAYRDWRGEPRGKGHDRTDTTGGTLAKGDCIDCMACVNVCPMGIDIRDGQQMECITCALCIDACDDVMARTGQPLGLIGYMALTDAPREQAGQPPRPVWRHILRPRTILYTVLWAAIGAGLVYVLFVRAPLEMTVSPVRNPTYVVQSDGAVRNIYDLRLRNKSGQDRPFRLTLTSDDALSLALEGVEGDTVTIPADTTTLQRIYVTATARAPAATAHATPLRLWVEDVDTKDRASTATTFNGRVQ